MIIDSFVIGQYTFMQRSEFQKFSLLLAYRFSLSYDEVMRRRMSQQLFVVYSFFIFQFYYYFIIFLDYKFYFQIFFRFIQDVMLLQQFVFNIMFNFDVIFINGNVYMNSEFMFFYSNNIMYVNRVVFVIDLVNRGSNLVMQFIYSSLELNIQFFQFSIKEVEFVYYKFFFFYSRFSISILDFVN